MGIDLKLIPAQKSPVSNANRWNSDTVLPLTRCHDLWILIAELPCENLSAPLYTPIGHIRDEDRNTLSDEEWEEDDYPRDLRCITEDVFDSPLCSVAASDLVTLRNHEEVRSSFQNKAAWAYLAELPPETKIVLFWC